MKKVYATEPLMHAGAVIMPGDAIDVDDNDAASIITSGRGTQNADLAKAAADQYAAAAKASADAAKAAVKAA